MLAAPLLLPCWSHRGWSRAARHTEVVAVAEERCHALLRPSTRPVVNSQCLEARVGVLSRRLGSAGVGERGRSNFALACSATPAGSCASASWSAMVSRSK